LALLGRRLAVSIPDTVLEEKESPRDKTAKLGLIARACAIYGVDVIEVFGDPGGKGEGDAIRKVLEYLETPQYLRKRLYPLDEALRYAGLLPPLRIPSHRAKVALEKVPPGQVREGVTNFDGTADIGLDAPFKLKGEAKPGRRVTVRVASVNPPVAEVIPRGLVKEYWGYSVEARSSDEVLADKSFGLKVATSRFGAPIAAEKKRLEAAILDTPSIKLIFGSPSKGLYDLFGKDLDRRVDFVLNLFPEQKVETVRTEEAIVVGLGLISVLSAEKA
jgi:predicted SPOUT superfamily RNA methylase MTH1